jgi:hypothetical protein
LSTVTTINMQCNVCICIFSFFIVLPNYIIWSNRACDVYISKVDCWGKGLRVCFEHLRLLNFAPDLSVCCGACLYSIGAEASID